MIGKNGKDLQGQRADVGGLGRDCATPEPSEQSFDNYRINSSVEQGKTGMYWSKSLLTSTEECKTAKNRS